MASIQTHTDPRDEILAALEKRLPRTDLVHPADIAGAMDVTVSTVMRWFDDGTLTTIDVSAGSGTQRRYRVLRSHVVQFWRRRLGMEHTTQETHT